MSPTRDQLRVVAAHVNAALESLPTDDEIDRLISPRHTDKDALVFLPRRVAKDIAQARREIQAALEELVR